MKPRVLSVAVGKDSPLAFDYGCKRLLACGCSSTILIFDQTNARCVQSLQGHRSTVNLISWAPEHCYHNHKTPYNHRLASTDISGRIIIWDITDATTLSEFSDLGYSVLDLAWISNQMVFRDLLLVLHSKGQCTLWNIQTRVQLWKVQVDETFSAFVIDPFNLTHLTFFNSSNVCIVNDFTVTAPFSFKAGPKGNDCGTSNFELGSLLRSKLPDWASLDDTPCSPDLPALSLGTTHSECVQMCYHGYRKDCAVFVCKRELVIVSFRVFRVVVSIQLDRSSSSFLRVYSCRQRDVLICVHENGSLSVYARQGLASPLEATASSADFSGPGLFAPYELVAQTEGSRRNARQTLKLRFTVDRSREINVALVPSEGRIQFWQLRRLPLQPVAGSQAVVAEPYWTLDSLLPHKPGLIKPPRLYLYLCSMYTASKNNVTTCRVCPRHILKPLADQLGCHALVAVGNSRGGVQIWDMLSASLWREYQLLPVPVLGVEWFTIPRSTDDRWVGEYKEGEEFANISVTSSRLPFHLGLLVYGWQPKDRPGSTSSPITDDSKSEGWNHCCLVNLSTGYVQNFRPNSPETTGGFPSSSGRTASAKNGSTFEGPIELARISHLGQYLALLIRNDCVELWSMISLKPIKRITFDPGYYGVALDWYQSVTQSVAQASQPPASSPSISPDLSPVESHPVPSGRRTTTYQRESFVLCTHPQSLRLIIVDGENTDTTVVSNAILQGLPSFASDRISAVAWFADLIAFGTADGFVALRDLHSKKTLIRMSSAQGWLAATDSGDAHPDQDVRSALNALTAVSRYNTGVRRLAFLPGSSTSSRLLAVLYDSLYLWEPREMTLLCTARFDGRLQRCLIDADWAYPISAPSDPALCITLGADGALRLVEVVGNGMEMVPVNSSPSSNITDQPVTRFMGSSPMAVLPNCFGPTFIPSVLPQMAALTVRHLLQHQPWRTPAKSLDSPTKNSATSTYELTCPDLQPQCSKVQSLVNSFLQTLEQRPEFRKSFLCPSATIAERCLWTAQLFDDSYEMQFWHMVANRLVHPPQNPWRYALDLSWDLLAEPDLYRDAALATVRLLEQTRSTSSDVDCCVHSLIMLGQHERAVSCLLETSPDSADYNVNMLRACLLASNVGQTPASNVGVGKTALAEDTHLSTVKLVATNFLSCGQLDRGIELLCLIGLYADACRYLESFDQWEKSLWLAKCALPSKESNKVFKRWAAYLTSSPINRKELAVLVCVMLDECNMALKLLCELGQYQLAARYLEACLEANLLSWTNEYDEMYRTIFFEFAKILLKLGHFQSTHYYCTLAGKLGESLKNELDILAG